MLEQRVECLETELQGLRLEAHNRRQESKREGGAQNWTDAVVGRRDDADDPHPDLIRLESGGDAHFLGVSSGSFT